MRRNAFAAQRRGCHIVVIVGLTAFLESALAIEVTDPQEQAVALQKSAGDANSETSKSQTNQNERAIAITVVDAATGKPVPIFRVLAGTPSHSLASAEFKARVGNAAVNVANWQPHTLRKGEDGKLTWPVVRTYPEMALRVEADGYQPQQSEWIPKGSEPPQLKISLIPARAVSGRVLQPDERPAAGAVVAVALPGKNIRIHGGRIHGVNGPLPQRGSDQWRLPVTAETDENGQFQLPAESNVASVVLVMHDSGVRELPYAEFEQHPEITLQEWGRIEGRVLWKDRPGAGQEIDLIIFRDKYGYPGMIECYAETQSDAEGRFIFEKVLPGGAQLSRFIKLTAPRDDNVTAVAPDGLSTHLVVNSGESTAALIGGVGRTVKGRFTGQTSWDDVTFHFHPNSPRPADRAGWEASGIFRSSEFGPLFFRDKLKPNADGSFEIPHVLPGTYQLFVSAPGTKNYAGYRRFSVGAETPDELPPELDLGEIPIKATDPDGAAR